MLNNSFIQVVIGLLWSKIDIASAMQSLLLYSISVGAIMGQVGSVEQVRPSIIHYEKV